MQDLKIIIFGDWGDMTHLARINANNIHKNKDVNFIILLGDNFYPSGVSSVFDPQWTTKYRELFNSNIDTFSVLGNHDYVLNPEAQIEYSTINKHWKMPFHYYDMMINLKNSKVHFIFIDTCIMAEDTTHNLLRVMNTNNKSFENFRNIKNKIQEKQNRWLEDVLKLSEAKWKIVCGHYPVFSKGHHKISMKFQKYLSNLFAIHGVDFYFSGHDHNMQHLQNKKTHYIISGAFSSFHRIPCLFDDSISKSGGFVRLLINDDRVVVEYIGTCNQVLYRFSCSKLEVQ